MNKKEENEKMFEEMSETHEHIEGQRGGGNIAQRQWLPEDFLFAGQKVMLNPEAEDYHRRKEAIGANIGYVCDHRVSDEDLITLLKNGIDFMPSWSVKVRFENEISRLINVDYLLPIDQMIEVKQYSFQDDMDRWVVGDDPEDIRKIDLLVIEKGKKIIRKKVYNEEFRKRMIAKAYEAMSEK